MSVAMSQAARPLPAAPGRSGAGPDRPDRPPGPRARLAGRAARGRDVPGAAAAHRRRLVAAALVALVLATAACAGWVISRSQAQRRETIAQRFDARQSSAARFTEAYVAQVLRHERRLATQVLTGDVPPARLDDITAQQQFQAAVLLDAAGRLLAVSPSDTALIGAPMAARYRHLSGALAGVPTVSDVVPSAARAEPVIGFAVPFDAPGGRRVFSGAYAIADTPLQPFITGALTSFRTGRVYLVDSAGTVIATDRTEQIGTPLGQVDAQLDDYLSATGASAAATSPDTAAEPAPVRSGILDARPNSAEGDDGGGVRRYVVAGPVARTPWRLVLVLDTSELYRSLTPVEVWSPWAALLLFTVMALAMVGLVVRSSARRAEAEAEHAGRQAILETAADAYIEMDDEGRVKDWNTAAARLFGWSADEAVGQPMSVLLIPPRDREAFTTALHDFLETGVAHLPTHPMSRSARHRDGHEIPIELTVSRTPWLGSWRFHAFARDITERLEHEQQLHDLALTDALTGLANRRAFLDRLDQAHSRARRQGTRLAVVYADVDHFKDINDTYGHAAGDSLLRQVADRLRAQFRTEDTIGRLGGDEFAVVCEDLATTPETLGARIHDALAVPYSFRGEPILATVSVGVAVPQADETTEHLLERADTTMYEAKATHR
jgi:diguanylate cyclase (GGDEF)-like protein/PAS domain S-box-containing protein